MDLFLLFPPLPFVKYFGHAKMEALVLMNQVSLGYPPTPMNLVTFPCDNLGYIELSLDYCASCRDMKKHTQYIKDAPLPCGVVRLKDGVGVEVIRSPSVKIPYTPPAVVPIATSPPQTPSSPVSRPRSPPLPPPILNRRGSWISGSGRRSPEYNQDLRVIYDVFISHRGTVKNGFVGYLDAALHNLLVHSFLDRKDLGVGEYIWDRLQTIIEQVWWRLYSLF